MGPQLPDVILTGAITDDDELAAIYSGAHALVYPSKDEGFGLPAVEALACGTPVAACDLPALREVLGGQATLRSIEDMDGLVAAAESARRPAPAPPSWTWEDAAAATWQVYADAVAEPDTWRSPHRRRAGGYRPCTSSVTGPSLTSSTSMCAPNTPRARRARSQKRS